MFFVHYLTFNNDNYNDSDARNDNFAFSVQRQRSCFRFVNVIWGILREEREKHTYTHTQKRRMSRKRKMEVVLRV